MTEVTPNRVYQYTTSTGTGNVEMDGAAVFASFFTAAEADLMVGDEVVALIEQGNDVEIADAVITVVSPIVTFSRTTVASKIDGVAGNTPINMTGVGTTVQFIIDGEKFDAKASADAANTWSAKQTFAATLKLQQALEKVTVTADNPASGDNNFDALTQAIQYYTTNTDTNWTLNVRGDGSNTLNSIMAVGESLTVAMLATNGATAYYMSALKIDGNAVTPKYLDGAAFFAGSISSIDAYTLTIIKTANATFTVLAQQTKWA